MQYKQIYFKMNCFRTNKVICSHIDRNIHRHVLYVKYHQLASIQISSTCCG